MPRVVWIVSGGLTITAATNAVVGKSWAEIEAKHPDVVAEINAHAIKGSTAEAQDPDKEKGRAVAAQRAAQAAAQESKGGKNP